jgi:outer membrane murein-binding lipoprotein Lpp
MRRTRMLLGAAIVATLLVGCGSSSSSSAGKPLSVAAWKQKINSICASVTKQSQAVAKPTTPAELPAFLKKLDGYGNSEIAQIKAVDPPAQFAAGQTAVVSDLTAIWGKLGSLISQNQSGPALVKAAQQFGAQVQKPASDYLTRTKAAGLSSCILNTGA